MNMKILTLTEAECRALTIRGDVPGVLDGYRGPVIWGGRTERIALGRVHDGHALVVDDSTGDMTHWAPSLDLRLPLANPLAQAHLVGWLGRGTSCPDFDGNSHAPVPDSPDQPPFCPRCRDTGYLRSPHNRYGWLTPKAHGGLPDWIRLALIWGSVVRAAAGMVALDVSPLDVSPGRFRRCLIPGGAWNYYPGADAGLLAQGFALIDETPAGRVIRFEVPDGST